MTKLPKGIHLPFVKKRGKNIQKGLSSLFRPNLICSSVYNTLKKGIKNLVQRHLSTSQKWKKKSNYFYQIESKAIDILVKSCPDRLKWIRRGLSCSNCSNFQTFKVSRKQNKTKNLTTQQHIASICNYTFHISIQSLVYI